MRQWHSAIRECRSVCLYMEDGGGRRWRVWVMREGGGWGGGRGGERREDGVLAPFSCPLPAHNKVTYDL